VDTPTHLFIKAYRTYTFSLVSICLCAGHVIKTWDEGVAGLKAGVQHTLIISTGMGYGAKDADGVISPNATLIFDIELLDIQ